MSNDSASIILELIHGRRNIIHQSKQHGQLYLEHNIWKHRWKLYDIFYVRAKFINSNYIIFDHNSIAIGVFVFIIDSVFADGIGWIQHGFHANSYWHSHC